MGMDCTSPDELNMDDTSQAGQSMDCTSTDKLNMDDTSHAGQSMDCSGPGGCPTSSSNTAESLRISTDMTSLSVSSRTKRINLDSEGELCYSS